MHVLASADRDIAAAPPMHASVWQDNFLRWLEYLCWVAAVAGLGWFLFVSADRLIFQAVQARRLAALRRGAAAVQAVQPDELLGKLTIPEIGLSAIVLEGDDETTLRRAVGHIPGTSFPDGSGAMGLAGHRDTFFRNLGALRPGDEIGVETPRGTYHYRVATTAIVDPTDIEVLRPQGRQSLTLVTCYPFHFIGSAPRRYVVTAWRIPDGPRPAAREGLKATVASPQRHGPN